MLKTRIIPCLDVKDGRVVKGVNFVDLRDAGDPVEQAKLYDAQGADELCFLDITASHEGRGTLYELVRRVAKQCSIPFTVGGGVRSVEDIRELLLAGADKVAINTAAVRRPEFVREAAEKFGAQCIVVAVDARRRRDDPPERTVSRGQGSPFLPTIPSADQRYEIYTHGGRNPTGIDALAWAARMAEYGAGEILLTSMDRDGTKEGYDIAMTRAVTNAVSIPVIASGGVGALEHFIAGAREGGATGLLAASVFHFGDLSIPQVKQALRAAGVPVRI